MAQATKPYFSEGSEAMDQTQIDYHAAYVLALLEAKKQVRRQKRRKGRVKVTLLRASTITRLAEDHLRAHPEFFQQAAQSPLARISRNLQSGGDVATCFIPQRWF